MSIWQSPSLIDPTVPPDWIDQWRDDRARLVSVGPQGQIGLVAGAAGDRLELTTSGGIDYDAHHHVYLGQLDRAPVFASLESTDSQRSWRDALAALSDAELTLAMRAAALAQYHDDHPFCSRCGVMTELHDLGRSRICPSCQTLHFPRIDPAVIVAVVDPANRLLLGHHAGWPAQLRSLFAGFAEAGESLEQTVRREVAEEVGLEVSQIRYVGSQPWPMPRSMMLGFTALADGSPPRPDGEEITTADWYDRAGFDQALTDGQIIMPPPVSIAFRLISQWRQRMDE